jgi:PAS domain S-box-containing protein
VFFKAYNIKTKSALNVAFIYFLFSLVYIIYSDKALLSLVQDPDILTQIQTYKGMFFISISSLLIFFLLRKELRQLEIFWKRATLSENKLSETELQYESLLESAPEAVFVWDPQMMRYIKANYQAEVLFGYPRSHFLNLGPWDLSPEYQPNGELSVEVIKPAIDTCLKEGRFGPFEFYHLNAKGHLLECEIRLVKISNQGRDIIRASINDISSRKKMERDRKQLTLDLRDKNQELEQILFVTSHDLRAPLVNIRGFSRELEIAIRDFLSALEKAIDLKEARSTLESVFKREIATDIRFIESGIDKMDALLTGLLLYSRTGRLSLEYTHIDMNSLVDKVIESLSYQIHQKKVSIEVSDLHSIEGDENQLNQVFTNLIDNAIKYLDPVRPGVIKVQCDLDDNFIHYHIIDNGRGIAKSHQDQVFKIFHRINPEIAEGLGIGMTVVRKIVQRHKGQVKLESDEGQGSCFTVSLPVLNPGS